MSNDQVNTSMYGKDDYSGFRPHKYSVSSRENNKYGPSMNPDGFLPEGTNPPPYLSRFKPEEPEPSEDQLYLAKRDAAECTLINEELGSKWLGIDYADPNAAYNCFCADEWPGGSRPDGPLTDYWVKEQHGFVGAPNRFVELPAVAATARTTAYVPPSYEVEECGANFDKYIEYSKTNATFWNTPPKTPLYRRAQTALLMYNRIRILVHGDFKVKPGNLIKIDYSVSFKNNDNIKKSRYDGTWMVYKVQHIITGIKHSMYLFLMRDGSGTDPNEYKKVIIGS